MFVFTKEDGARKEKKREEKKGDLLALINDHRLIREDDLMFHIRKSMEEVQSTCQKVELS